MDPSKNPDAKKDFQELMGGLGQQPPEQPDCYTDGCFKNPQNQMWGIGGYGIVHPHRNLLSHPLSLNESDFAYFERDGGALSLWGPMPGQRNSSKNNCADDLDDAGSKLEGKRFFNFCGGSKQPPNNSKKKHNQQHSEHISKYSNI